MVACLTLCLQLSSFTMCRASNGTKRPYAEDEGDVTDDEIVPVAKKSKPQRAHEEYDKYKNEYDKYNNEYDRRCSWFPLLRLSLRILKLKKNTFTIDTGTCTGTVPIYLRYQRHISFFRQASYTIVRTLSLALSYCPGSYIFLSVTKPLFLLLSRNVL